MMREDTKKKIFWHRKISFNAVRILAFKQHCDFLSCNVCSVAMRMFGSYKNYLQFGAFAIFITCTLEERLTSPKCRDFFGWIMWMNFWKRQPTVRFTERETDCPYQRHTYTQNTCHTQRIQLNNGYNVIHLWHLRKQNSLWYPFRFKIIIFFKSTEDALHCNDNKWQWVKSFREEKHRIFKAAAAAAAASTNPLSLSNNRIIEH